MVLIAECATIQQVRLRKLQLMLFRLVGRKVKLKYQYSFSKIVVHVYVHQCRGTVVNTCTHGQV